MFSFDFILFSVLFFFWLQNSNMWYVFQSIMVNAYVSFDLFQMVVLFLCFSLVQREYFIRTIFWICSSMPPALLYIMYLDTAATSIWLNWSWNCSIQYETIYVGLYYKTPTTTAIEIITYNIKINITSQSTQIDLWMEIWLESYIGLFQSFIHSNNTIMS